MATVATAYGSHPRPFLYGSSQLPGVTEVQSTFDLAVSEVITEFANRSVQATALGIKALDAGEYVTLATLEDLISKG